MTDPQSTDLADVDESTKRVVVAARQPDSDSGTHFHRVFHLPAGAVAGNDSAHESHRWNKDETLRDAARRGLHPTSDEATVESVELQDDGTQRVTYSVPVDPTGSAASVSFPTPPEAAAVPADQPTPEPPTRTVEAAPDAEQPTP
jgi:hypothetical protein